MCTVLSQVVFDSLFYAYKCTVLLPPGVNPIAVNNYIDIKINQH